MGSGSHHFGWIISSIKPAARLPRMINQPLHRPKLCLQSKHPRQQNHLRPRAHPSWLLPHLTPPHRVQGPVSSSRGQPLSPKLQPACPHILQNSLPTQIFSCLQAWSSRLPRFKAHKEINKCLHPAVQLYRGLCRKAYGETIHLHRQYYHSLHLSQCLLKLDVRVRRYLAIQLLR